MGDLVTFHEGPTLTVTVPDLAGCAVAIYADASPPTDIDGGVEPVLPIYLPVVVK